MDEIKRLGGTVRRERLKVVAAAVSAGATQYAELARGSGEAQLGALDIETRSPEAAAARRAAANRLAVAGRPLYAAIRREERSFQRGRVDPLRDAIGRLEEFVWLCWALVDFPSTIQPRTLGREIAGELLGEACRISTEVVYLLRGGFYGGAQARWRSIYELALYCEFISRFGDEAAARFAAHRSVMRSRMADTLKEYGPSWGMDQLTDEQAAEIARDLAAAQATYGDEFVSEYGWAAPFVPARGSSPAGPRSEAAPKPRRGRGVHVTLAHLEQAVGMERWRAKTRVSSAFVHGRLASAPSISGNDSLSLRLALADHGDGHVGALTGILLSSLTQVVVELSVNQSNDAERIQAWLVAASVEELRQQLDRKFVEADDSLVSMASADQPT